MSALSTGEPDECSVDVPLPSSVASTPLKFHFQSQLFPTSTFAGR